MILQRDTSNRRLQQQQYRQQLYNSIQQKQAGKNKSRVYQPQDTPQTFSLIKNIQDQQERRKNRQKDYYAELERQRQEEIALKKKKQEDEKRMQLQLDKKIEKQNQMLRKRYEQEKLKENKNNKIAEQRAKQMQEQYVKREQQKTERKEKQRAERKQQQNRPSDAQFPQDSLDAIQMQQNYQQENNDDQFQGNGMSRVSQQQMPITFVYPTRIQNQQFNFPERRVLSTNYYRQLQLEKRKFEEETNEMRQLNRYLGAQKSGFSKRNNQGLESLRQLQKILDDQTSSLKHEYSNPFTNSMGSRSKTQNSGYNSGYYAF